MKNVAVLLLLFALIMAFTSCKKDNPDSEKSNTFYGPQVQVGNGKVRSWITIDHDKQPLEMGIEMTPGALEGLPHHQAGEAHPHWDIPFHQKVIEITPFDHLTVYWNPEGHAPCFEDPHFDIHFYMTTVAERMAIPAYSPTTDVYFNTFPPAGYMPADYSTPPGAVGAEPAMGKHWLPPPSTFLPFSHVMILGAYNGQFNFIEPMVTLNFLKSGQAVSKDYSQPQKFAKAGNYPTKYNVLKDEKTGNHLVSLSHFVWRNAD